MTILKAGIKTGIIIVMALLMSSCAIPKNAEGLKAPRTGVLIVYGKGLIPEYDVEKVSAVALDASQVFASTLQSNLHTYEAPAHLHGNYDKRKKIREQIPYLLAVNNVDALVQVSIVHEKSASENNIYLQALYTPLAWEADSNEGRHVILQPGVLRKYKVFSADESFQQPSISGLAIRFCKLLRQEGFTRSECEKF